MLAVQGSFIIDLPYCIDPHVEDIEIVNPDLNADCRGNLSDLGIFGLSYNKDWGETDYNDCCDYNDDSRCNLSDFAWFGEHYQHECFE